MSYKRSQLSPASTNKNIRVVVHGPWDATLPEKFRDMQFWRSWVEYDSELEEHGRRSRLNWNAILGIAVTTSISGVFWTGVGFLIARLAS